ncbi:MAG: indolepyruvate ferredoxin oxidoreductase family protein [Rhodocyclaceae bacterium]|nr:indolepyruvate ferredoxin oxidoreductase family protein [Rhodocyclaceae bacterium]
MGKRELAAASLDDKYSTVSGRVFLTGYQALARLPIMQRQRDVAAGINTAGFISGYRGSPLGGLDLTLWKAKAILEANQIVFRAGLNEDMAATACWGTQQVNLYPKARYDGVFAIWYGKGPGVDRCGDVLRHANACGTSRHGGVLAIAGDDHAAKSSTLPHQTEHIFKAVMMPVLAPAGVQEYLDYGLHGFAMSRYSGCWVAFKALADTVESSATVDVDPARVQILLPENFALPPGGLNLRWPDPPLVQEERLLHHKLYAALAYCRTNGLNRIVIDSPRPRLGIITAGKSYLDVRQALADLGIDERMASEIGLRLYKVGMVWPLESEGVRQFADGLEEILVVEEKRQLLEYQLKEELYNWREDVRPRVIGKFDEKGEWALPHGDWLLPAAGELTPAMVARAIASRIERFHTSERIRARLEFLSAKEKSLAQPVVPIARIPYFCPGCPHNTSTRVPEGSRATAGIGCHYMVTWMNRNTSTFSHMGGEGVGWIGQAPFTDEEHIFVNLGDGTYFHSGVLAIRAAVAANVPITYKILYNDAVAMTGGQPVDGSLSVPQLAQQLAAEGVHNIVVLTDGTARPWGIADLPHGVALRGREELDMVQKELRTYRGVSALIYDQTCAAEKRRRRKRGRYPDPAVRAYINTAVCEGCGDCGTQSNCLAVVPVETDFGRKRAIDQSACNKDYSCLNGFCPSFVTVHGGKLRRGQAAGGDDTHFPEPPLVDLPGTAQPYGILITGVGGTGVITLGALLGMAAHLDGKGATVLDMTGLAQKGGAVFSHVRIADHPEHLHAVRIAAGEADAILGGDVITTAQTETLAKTMAGKTRAVVNCTETPTADFTSNPDWKFPLGKMQQVITDSCGAGRVDFIDAQTLATRLMGDAIATNSFLLGYCWQRGLLPVSLAALTRAIELNGVAVDMNLKAVLWGRRAACDLAAVKRHVLPPEPLPLAPGVQLDQLIARRSALLTDYQDATYAAAYTAFVTKVRSAESALGSTRLTEAVARYLYKLMAYKDEYEVARLYTDPAFQAQLNEQFEGDYHLEFHLAPPLFNAIDPNSGRPGKRRYGPWMMKLFGWLARLKGLRGTKFDLFGRSEERRLERELIVQYRADIEALLPRLAPANLAAAVDLAELPEQIRGFGPIKLASMERARAEREARLARFEAACGSRAKAAQAA